MQPIPLYKKLLAEFGPQHWWPLYSLKEGRCVYKQRAKLTSQDLLEISLGAISLRIPHGRTWRKLSES